MRRSRWGAGARGEKESGERGNGPESGVSGMRRKERRKLRAYARMVMKSESTSAVMAARRISGMNGSPALPQMVRVSPRKEKGGRRARLWGAGMDISESS